jgi:hypothetical protein
MTDDEKDTSPAIGHDEVQPDDLMESVQEGTQTRAWPLLLGALALIAVPTFIGYLTIRGDGAPSAENAVAAANGVSSDGMGSSASVPDSGELEVVLDFAEIQATEIAIESDPSGNGAVLRVNTNIDVACAVAYGPTTELGSLATDTDMAGGGHSVHKPLMRGLSIGETYYYRVQAIGPDGVLYQSDLMQFTYTGEPGGGDAITPPAPNAASFGRVTDVSSEYSDAFSGSNAIDGDLSTEWSSAGDGDDAYIVLAFSDLMIVEGVGFRTREMTDGTSITLSFTVTVDGGATYGPFEAGPGLAVALVDFTGYELRFDVEASTGGNTGAVEVEVYGEAEM